MALVPVPTLSEKHCENCLSLPSLYNYISLPHHVNRTSRFSITSSLTEFQKRLQKQSSRRETGEYFSTNVKKYRRYNPQNPTRKGKSRLLLKQREQARDNGLQNEDSEQNVQTNNHSLAQHTTMMSIVEELRKIREAHASAENGNMTEGPNEAVVTMKDDANEAKFTTDVSNINGFLSETDVNVKKNSCPRTAGELLLPKPNQNLFSIGNYWTTPDHPIPTPGRDVLDAKFPWEFEDVKVNSKKEEDNKRVKPPTLAELLIPPQELRRLRTLGIPLKNPLKIGRLGVTDNIADSIMRRWKNSELVKVKCEGPAAIDMLKIHRDLERKTGGLVIWRAGSVAVVYRGSDFDTANNTPSCLERKLEGFITPGYLIRQTKNGNGMSVTSESTTGTEEDIKHTMHQSVLIEPDQVTDEDAHLIRKPLGGQSEMCNEVDDVDFHKSNGTVTVLYDDASKIDETNMESNVDESRIKVAQGLRRLNVKPDPFIEREYELEIESILEELGPRYSDWKGLNPVPVDADLLPSTVPNYRPPYRLLPYGVKPKLTDKEQTDLRRLFRPVVPHFVLGKNYGLQGLSAAILKIWEKSEVAKIAIKPRVQNTNNEKMAEELKRLTGGVLLGRDKYVITLYRGKDFLPQQIAFALTERLSLLRNQKRENTICEDEIQIGIKPNTAGSTNEKESEKHMIKETGVDSKQLAYARVLERKLGDAMDKKQKAKKELEKLESLMLPVNSSDDKETITEEERYMLRKVGLKMSAFLRIGRRGVFDGIVENMHLHWKYRELVKLIVKERDPLQLQKTAKLLEHASGGILVAVVETSKGQVIIMYRGKNYQRPSSLRPSNLLSKQKALERSLEMQRYSSISRQIQVLEKEISRLQMSLGGTTETNDVESNVVCSTQFDGDHSEKSDEHHEAKTAYNNEDPTASTDSERDNHRLAERRTLIKLVESGPIFRSGPLTNLERLKLRKIALKLGIGSRFNVGKNNVLARLARHIRVHFLRHALVVIGVKNRGRGTSLQDLIHELEELTGGVLVSQEPNHIILYRGWPNGEKIPIAGICEDLSPELRAVLESEDEGWDLVDDDSNLKPSLDGFTDILSDDKAEGGDFAELFDSGDEMYMLSDEEEGDDSEDEEDDSDYDFTQLLESDDDSSDG